MRRTSLFEVNQRFCRTIGRIRASATALRNRLSKLSWDSPGRKSTLIHCHPLPSTVSCCWLSPCWVHHNNLRAAEWRATHYSGHRGRRQKERRPVCKQWSHCVRRILHESSRIFAWSRAHDRAGSVSDRSAPHTRLRSALWRSRGRVEPHAACSLNGVDDVATRRTLAHARRSDGAGSVSDWCRRDRWTEIRDDSCCLIWFACRPISIPLLQLHPLAPGAGSNRCAGAWDRRAKPWPAPCPPAAPF